MTRRHRFRLRTALAVAALVLLAAPHWPALLDDLFITTAYAYEWVGSGVLRWTTGEVVEGYSNTLWLLILAGAAALGVDTLLVAKLVSLGAAVVFVVGLSWLSPRDVRGDVLVLAVVVWAPFAWWAVLGMETMAFAALLAFGWALALDGRPGTRAGAAVLLGLAAMAHLEGHAHLVLALVAAGGRGPRPRREDLGVLAVIAALIGWHLVRVWHFGHLVPTPAVVKLVGVSMTGQGLGQAAAGLITATGVLAAAAVALRPRARDLPWVVAPLAIQAALLIRADGDWMGHARFLLPGLCASVLAAAVTSRGAGPRWLAAPAALVAVGAGLLVPGQGFHLAPRDLAALANPIAAYRGGFGTVLAEDLEYVVETIPDGQTLFTTDVGIVGQVAGVWVRDGSGLVDREQMERRAAVEEDPATIAARYGSGPGEIGFVRVRWTGERPSVSAWFVRRFVSSMEVFSPVFRATWYRAIPDRPPRETVRARWEALHDRYPRISWLAWHAALARADAGGPHDDRPREGIDAVADVPDSLSFTYGPIPLVWVRGRGFALYTDGALISRPLSAADDGASLVLDVDDPGVEGARVRLELGACRAQQLVGTRTAVPIAELCPSRVEGDRLIVRFDNDSTGPDHDRNLYAVIVGPEPSQGPEKR